VYSVFLVEDEIVVREGIRNSIPWDETPYALAGEAPDGEMALAIIKDVKPDILITDIRMPFMDGLALSRIVKKTMPWIKIIILSGHDEFQYAKEAISIGVEEYLLKPVTSLEMLASLGKVAARIEEEKKKLDGVESLRLQVQSHAEAMRERWLADLVTGLVETGVAAERAREHGIDLVARLYCVAIAELRADDDDFREIAKAKRTILPQAADRADLIAFAHGVDRLVFVFKGESAPALEETAYAYAQGIKFEAERNTRCSVAVAIGPQTGRIGGISNSFAEAARVMKYLSATGRRVIMGVNDVQLAEESGIGARGTDPVADSLRTVNREDIECLADQYSDMLGDNPVRTNFIAYYLLYDVVVAAAAIIDELGGDIKAVFPNGVQQESIGEISASREAFKAEVCRIVGAIVDLRESLNASRYGGMIQKAKRYIDEHFADPDISLHTVASYVNVSPNHFSAIFSQESGESFIDYLTCVRIDHAKKLLSSSQMKGADIAYESGFNDPHYFSFIFKKRTGVSPRDYRAEKNEPNG